MRSSPPTIVLLLIVAISNAIEWDHHDTIKIDMNMSSPTRFNLTWNVAAEFVVVVLNATRTNLTISLDERAVVFGRESLGLVFAVVKPLVALPFCSTTDNCGPFTVVLDGDEPVRVRVFRGTMLQIDERVVDVVAKTRTKRYGIELDEPLLPALISTRPDVAKIKVDVDMFVYSEHEPFTYLFPNDDNRNHRWNYAEEMKISSDLSSWRPGMYIIEVYASCDTTFDLNTFDLIVFGRVQDDVVLTLIGMAIAMFLALAGCIFMLAVVHQHRRRVMRTIRLQQLVARHHLHHQTARASAATSKQIEVIPLHDYNSLKLDKDDARCPICLCDYEAGDQLRQIGCGHHFHNECLVEWLQKSSICPLCQQNITTAIDHRKASAMSSVEVQEAFKNGEHTIDDDDINLEFPVDFTLS